MAVVGVPVVVTNDATASTVGDLCKLVGVAIDNSRKQIDNVADFNELIKPREGSVWSDQNPLTIIAAKVDKCGVVKLFFLRFVLWLANIVQEGCVNSPALLRPLFPRPSSPRRFQALTCGRAKLSCVGTIILFFARGTGKHVILIGSTRSRRCGTQT